MTSRHRDRKKERKSERERKKKSERERKKRCICTVLTQFVAPQFVRTIFSCESVEWDLETWSFIRKTAASWIRIGSGQLRSLGPDPDF